MVLQDARKLKNTEMALRWRDRHGDVQDEDVFIMQFQFVPMYGPCLITSHGEIPLEKIESAIPVAQRTAA